MKWYGCLYLHIVKPLKMKAKTSQKKAKGGKTTASPRRKAEDRGLNEDDQNRITNADGQDDDRPERFPQNEVEAEEERERRRRTEDARGIENES
jgi:hypothetical protein